MKWRISATVDKETVRTLKDLVKSGKYRNASHIIESGIELVKEVSKKEDKK